MSTGTPSSRGRVGGELPLRTRSGRSDAPPASEETPCFHASAFRDMGPNIRVLAITGGPCGGKSSGMAMLHRRLTDRGWKVFVVPEAATILINGGLFPNDVTTKRFFQRQVMLTQIQTEDVIMQAALKYSSAGHRVVILCDRGAMDGRAFMDSEEDWSELLAGLSLTEQQICEHRYHGVVHLRSVADGAEACYTVDNNPARALVTASAEEALRLDKKVAVAWQRHPCQRFIENIGVSWPQKLQNLLDEVLLLVDPETKLTFAEHKFVIERIGGETLKSHVEFMMAVTIEETLLVSDQMHRERRVRRSIDSFGQKSLTFIGKTRESSSRGLKVGNILTKKEYASLMMQRDPSRLVSTITKSRFSFFFDKNLVKIDVYSAPPCLEGLALMTIEQQGIDKSAALSIPPFVHVKQFIQDIPKFLEEKLGPIGESSSQSPPPKHQKTA